MLRLTTTTAAVALALLAPAMARAGQPQHVPVPAGQLQHTVTELSFPTDKNTFHHDALRNESWVGASAAREITTNLTTHKVREDCQYTVLVTRCWAAPLSSREPAAGVINVLPGSPILLQSWDDVGAGVKALVDQPRGYRVTGNTTYLGHQAVTLEQDAQRGPDGGIERASIIADAGNYYPLRRDDIDSDQPYAETDGRKGTEEVEQVTDTKTMEVISPAGVQLSIDPHPHAKVVDERPAAIAARKRAAARRRAAARKRAAARRRHKHTGYARR